MAIAPTQVYLSWTAPSQTYKQDITGYKIEEKFGNSYKVIKDNSGTGLGYTVNDVTTGKPHTYVVTALFRAGSSPRSNEISVTPTSTSVAPAGFSTTQNTQPQTTTKSTGNDPTSILKAEQDQVEKLRQQAREEMLKKAGKTDSDKAKATREEAQKANQKAIQDTLTKKQQETIEKQNALKAAQTKNSTQTTPQKATSVSKPKTIEEARKLAEEAKQKALEKSQVKTTPEKTDQTKAEQEMAAAKAAAWAKAQKALEDAKAQAKK